MGQREATPVLAHARGARLRTVLPGRSTNGTRAPSDLQRFTGLQFLRSKIERVEEMFPFPGQVFFCVVDDVRSYKTISSANDDDGALD